MGKTIRNFRGDGMKRIKKVKHNKPRKNKVDTFGCDYDDDYTYDLNSEKTDIHKKE